VDDMVLNNLLRLSFLLFIFLIVVIIFVSRNHLFKNGKNNLNDTHHKNKRK